MCKKIWKTDNSINQEQQIGDNYKGEEQAIYFQSPHIEGGNKVKQSVVYNNGSPKFSEGGESKSKKFALIIGAIAALLSALGVGGVLASMFLK